MIAWLAAYFLFFTAGLPRLHTCRPLAEALEAPAGARLPRNAGDAARAHHPSPADTTRDADDPCLACQFTAEGIGLPPLAAQAIGAPGHFPGPAFPRAVVLPPPAAPSSVLPRAPPPAAG